MESLVKADLESFYKGKKVFVTGHTGFKGSWFIALLNLLGASVKGYALAPTEENGLFNSIEKNIAVENVFADIRDKEKLEKEILAFQPDLIFHLAAQALVRKSYAIPSETFEVNVVGTAHVLEPVKHLEKKCTVVVITTDKVYENKEINYHYKEEDRLGGYDPYSASKAAAEIVVNSFRDSFFNRKNYRQHQKAIVSARAGNVIGGGDFSKDRIIPDIIKDLSGGQTIGVRNPAAVRPWQHVLEPLNGYLTLGMKAYNDYGKISNAYNFGPNLNDHLPVKNLVETSISCWGSGKWEDRSEPNQPHEAGLLMLDISKAKDELNWQPKLQSHEAIEWTINWYKQGGDYHFTLQQIQNYQQL